MIGFAQVKSKESIFNFNKTNNYSKTYTYNSDKTDYYIITEVVDWDCVTKGGGPEDCSSLQKVYFFSNDNKENKKLNKMKEMSKVDWSIFKQ